MEQNQERAARTDRRDPALTFIIDHWAQLPDGFKNRIVGVIEGFLLGSIIEK